MDPAGNPDASDFNRAFDRVTVPTRARSPLEAVARRIGFALALVLFVAVVVRLGRDGYVDDNGGTITFLDALYYASVTVTTTGYGDIAAVDEGSRLAATLLITPARILFLILVVGTTVEVLTDQSRRAMLTKRWRSRVKDHYLICGFGATGQSAAADLMSRGIAAGDIVVVDVDDQSLDRAERLGLVGVRGNATSREVLQQAAITRAKAVIVAPNRDDTAVLIVLTVRELNPGAHIVAGGREQENLHLLRQGGADEVVDATAAVGRMLGLGTYAPGAVEVVDDLLDASAGLELTEVAPAVTDGRPTVPSNATLVAIVRDGDRVRADQLSAEDLRPDDRLIVVQESSEARNGKGLWHQPPGLQES